MFFNKAENGLKQNDEAERSLDYNKYTLKYLYNSSDIFFHLFINTKIYDKKTNQNIENQGILLRSWNPITKRGERYVFKKGEEGEGDLNIKKVYLPDTKTVFEFSQEENLNEGSYKLAKEIIHVCPHKDIQLRFSDREQQK
ncbi:MAG: hypothetical protein WCB31_09260 [Nitrososphaeraceae archaeon]